MCWYMNISRDTTNTSRVPVSHVLLPPNTPRVEPGRSDEISTSGTYS